MQPKYLLQCKHKEKSKLIFLVLTWHYQIQGISKVTHSSYSTVAEKVSELKTVSKEGHIVAFRFPNSLSSYLVKNRNIPKENSTPKKQRKSKTMINKCTNPLITIANQMSKQTCTIQRGKPSDNSVAYAAECANHKLMYIEQTGNQLKNQFNRHRSDIRYYPHRCELSNTSIIKIATIKKTSKLQF